MEHAEVLSVDDDLLTVSDLTIQMNNDDADLVAWIVDTGDYNGYAYLGSACQYGKTGWGQSKTSITRGPSRTNAIIETAEVCRN